MNVKKVVKVLSLSIVFLFLVYSVVLIGLNIRSNYYIKYSYLSVHITLPNYAGQNTKNTSDFNSAITINSDGSVTRKVYYWEYNAYKSYLLQNAKNSLEKMVTNDEYAPFLGVKYSDGCKEITLTVDKEKYDNDLGAADVSLCVHPAFVYRVACGDVIDENIIIIHLLDQDGNSIGDYSYPSDFNVMDIFMEHLENIFSFDF